MISIGWFIGLAVLAFLALYLRGIVGRLDRLHLRVEAAQEALNAQLLRRASLVRELAVSGWLDPASSLLLLDACQTTQRAEGEERPHAESVLSKSLRTVIDEPEVIDSVREINGGEELLAQLAHSSERVVLARRFCNEAVRQTRDMRARGIVRALRLAGHAPLPESFEMDDAPSSELARFAESAA